MTFAEKLARAAAAPRLSKTVTVCLNQELGRRRDALTRTLAGLSTSIDDLSARIETEKAASSGRLSLPADPSDLEQQRTAAELERTETETALDALGVEAADDLVDLKFTQMDGFDWTDLTMRHPGRDGVIADAMVGGYNVVEATREAVVRSGVRLEGTTEIPMPLAEWISLLAVLSPFDIARITDAIYFLNDYEPGQAVEAAKKARGATTDSDETSS